jgi:hypothetical protein
MDPQSGQARFEENRFEVFAVVHHDAFGKSLVAHHAIAENKCAGTPAGRSKAKGHCKDGPGKFICHDGQPGAGRYLFSSGHHHNEMEI